MSSNSRAHHRTVRKWSNRFTDEPFKTAWLVLSVTTATLTIVGGLAIRWLDQRDFHSVSQGMWWSIQTVTTVGYGDLVPTTAVVVMVTGIAFLTVTSAAVTNIFIERARRNREGDRDVFVEIANLNAQITALTDEVRALRKERSNE
jgi:voltage-gated potassium channel